MEKQLAIKGHETRGNEVIEILKMLGASNKYDYTGSYPSTLYILDDNDIIISYDCDYVNQEIFKLEEFLEKYPFKIGDKVINDDYSGYGIITEMVWDSVDWSVKYCVKFEDFGTIAWFNSHEIKFPIDICLIGDKDPLHELCENLREDKLSMLMIDSEVCKDEVEIVLNDYEIEVRGDKIYAVKKKPTYPTTYEECCGILGLTFDYPDIRMVSIDEYNLYSNFIQLIRCRDAYWKVAGEQMGLGESWKPSYTSLVNNEYFTIHTFNNEIIKSGTSHRNAILAFPTEEMRDMFFENFKELIEKCVKLL